MLNMLAATHMCLIDQSQIRDTSFKNDDFRLARENAGARRATLKAVVVHDGCLTQALSISR